MKKKIIELTEKIYSDKLTITITKTKVKFNVLVDDVGNTWIIKKEELKKQLE